METTFSTNQFEFRSSANSDTSNELNFIPLKKSDKKISTGSRRKGSIRRQITTDSGVGMNPNCIEKESPYVSVNFARQLSDAVNIKHSKENTLTNGKD